MNLSKELVVHSYVSLKSFNDNNTNIARKYSPDVDLKDFMQELIKKR